MPRRPSLHHRYHHHHTSSQSNHQQQQQHQLSRSQRVDAMARKKDERAARKKQRKSASNDVVSADDKSFSAQLAVMGLCVREVVGDGNCLFRALADQLDGDDHAHSRHRQDVVRYITEHRDDFEPFIEDDVPFSQHVEKLSQDGTYGGNDSIVAFARLHKLTVVIHQLDSPAWEVHGETADGTTTNKAPSLVQQLHISYHNGEHYASVRRVQDHTDSPANVHISPQTPTDSSATTDTDRQTQITGLETCNEPFKDPADVVFIERVLEITQCHNRQLVSDICADAGYFDLDLVCSQVMTLMDGVRSSSSSTTSDAEVATATSRSAATAGAKAKSRSTRRQRKHEKKARAALRHQSEAATASSTSTSSTRCTCTSGTRCTCTSSSSRVVAGAETGRLASSDDDDVNVTGPVIISQQLKVLQI